MAGLNLRPTFPEMAALLKDVMDREKGESRGNLGRVVLAVHTVLGSNTIVLSNNKKLVFSADQSGEDSPPPSELNYCFKCPLGSREAVKEVVVRFSTSLEDNIEYVTVSASTLLSSDDSNVEAVQRVAFDLRVLAGPLISSQHGAIGDREETVIVEFWRELNYKLCYWIRIHAFLYWSQQPIESFQIVKPCSFSFPSFVLKLASDVCNP